MSDTTDRVATYVAVNKLRESHRCYTRLQELREFYVREFNEEPQFYVKVPGRVNLIGEHVDYCGYPVMPMAIEQCILLAVGSTMEHSFLYLRNIKEKFENYKCDLNSFSIDIYHGTAPEWYKYFLCGVKGIFEKTSGGGGNVGMSVALSGNIPHSSGLSSSSALVCSATLATSYVYKVSLDKKWLANVSASCERYIGTEGGGMDQAIAFLAEEGCAQLIEFYPELKSTPVTLPLNACFVIANSLAEKNKAASSDFNERVVECRLAVHFIAKQMDLENWKEITKLVELQSELQCSLKEMEQVIKKILTKEMYTRTELIDEFQVCRREFEHYFLTPNTSGMIRFQLRERALHVIQESIRVLKFRTTCETEELPSALESNVELLAYIMQQSHFSLHYMYDCSHPDLDTLVELSTNNEVGSRMTGAGWGGCIVAICSSVEEAERYIRLLKDKYYSTLPKAKTNNIDDLIFITLPRSGAEILVTRSIDIK